MIIDLGVGAVVLISSLIAFLRGFIREILTIAGVGGGILAAIFAGPHIAPFFRSWMGLVEGQAEGKFFDLIPMGLVADISAYAAAFVIVVIIISIISHFLAGAAKAVGLGPIDRTLGVIFGIARGIVLLGLFYLPFHLLLDDATKQDYFSESSTYIFVEKTAILLAGFLPEGDVEQDIQESIKEKLQEQDILKNPNAKEEEIVAPDNENAGYKEEQRDNIQELFDQKAIEEPSYNE